ncbi:vacuolar protein sorting-associated protein 52 homolog isoform X3 [Haemorhous mexicanus]|uniref:vacuolar protein sorting-associated protein 52 homolog isoform X3 n=1 Tax=Haemorhous mexicanus TaxID=30427 RepID=UPI0028BECBD0|nr:vacuolar protein sorting-associated protein 52 homolog isoform X3 [Haemorhous mexicanus]
MAAQAEVAPAAGEVAAMEAPLEAELEAELDLEGAELEEVDVHIQENLEDALVQEALQTGVDLRQYSRQVELELQEVERASIQDYIRESENIAELHNQISACDAILQRMEEMLGSFQSSLSSLSWEIRALQGQAGAMNLRLRNRREVRERLGGLLDELVVPPEMISVILESPVTSPEFQAQPRALDGIGWDFHGTFPVFDVISPFLDGFGRGFSHFLTFSPHFSPAQCDPGVPSDLPRVPAPAQSPGWDWMGFPWNIPSF